MHESFRLLLLTLGGFVLQSSRQEVIRGDPLTQRNVALNDGLAKFTPSLCSMMNDNHLYSSCVLKQHLEVVKMTMKSGCFLCVFITDLNAFVYVPPYVGEENYVLSAISKPPSQ